MYLLEQKLLRQNDKIAQDRLNKIIYCNYYDSVFSMAAAAFYLNLML